LRTCKLELAEFNRQLVAMARSGATDMPALVERSLQLKSEVKAAQKQCEDLSLELENPSSKIRKWRFLGSTKALASIGNLGNAAGDDKGGDKDGEKDDNTANNSMNTTNKSMSASQNSGAGQSSTYSSALTAGNSINAPRDPDKETLIAKIHWLEERLNGKKEQLLEKELIVEEVTILSEKLRQQAITGRQGTLKLSQNVNLFQAKMKEVTRQMMATVSELSMYQATAMKLQEETNALEEGAVEARARVKVNWPPTADADQEFAKILHQERLREYNLQCQKARAQEEDILNSNATRTTAEPRVNAYVPEGEYGLPKAYGKHTPFKPPQPGSTMRHIRKPIPQAVEI
jgi:hypothetical protein